MTITIYLRDLDKNYNCALFEIEITTIREAKKIFNGLIKQWNSKRKGVTIPNYGVAIASDRIHSIIFNEDK